MKTKPSFLLFINRVCFLVMLAFGLAQCNRCRQVDHFPQVSAITACGYQQSWVLDKKSWVLDKHSSNVATKTLYPNWVTKGLPLESGGQNYVKMATQPPGSGLDMWFSCEGEVRFGCIDNPAIPQDQPQSMYDITYTTSGALTLECRRDYLRNFYMNTMGQRNQANYKYDATDTACSGCCQCKQKFLDFFKECYCKFNNNACKFSHFDTGAYWPGQSPSFSPVDTDGRMKLKNDFNDFYNAQLEIKQSQADVRIMNITMFSNMGHGISFRLEIVICGDETIVCTPCTDRVVQQQPTATPWTWTASDTQGAFTLTYDTSTYTGERYGWLDSDPTPPQGRLQCGMKTVGLFTDCAGTNSFSHSYITADLGNLNADGHFPIVIQRATPFPKVEFYYVQTTKGQKQDCQKYIAEICGHENVRSNYAGPTTFGPYDKSHVSGTKVAPLAMDVNFFSVIDSTFCNNLAYSVVMDNGVGGFKASTHLSLGGGSGLTLFIDISIPTSSPFVQKHYIMAKTTSGRFMTQEINFSVCGAEIITAKESSEPRYFYFYNHSGGLHTVRDVSLDFDNTNKANCDFEEYWIQIENPATVFSNFSAYGDSTKQVYIDNGDKNLKMRTLTTWAPYEYTSLWVTATTKARQTAKYKIKVKICGAENFVNLNGQTIFVWQKNEGQKTIDNTLYRTTDDTECPIDLRQVGTNNPPWVQWVNDADRIIYAGTDLTVNTSTPQLQPLRLRFTTVSFHATMPLKETFQDILVKVCGLETVTATKPTTDLINYFFYYNTGTHYPQTTPNTIDTWFFNNDVSVQLPPPASNQDCPIVKYELLSPWTWYAYTDNEVTATLSPPVLKIDTTYRNMKQDFWLNASTAAGNYALQKFEVWICGQETVKVAKKLELVILEYDPNKVVPDTVVDIPPLIDSTDQKCPVIQYDLLKINYYTSKYEPYTQSRIRADINNLKIYLQSGKPGREFVYLKATTKGNIIGQLEIEIEVCGTELVHHYPYKPDRLYLEYLQFSGQLNIQTVREHRYQSLLYVNSTRCIINWKISQLVYYDHEFKVYRPYLNETVKFDRLKEQLYINTTNITYQELFLAIKTNTSKVYYFPITVNIVKFPTEKFNKAPEFLEPSDLQVDFHLNFFSYRYNIVLNVTEQFDDHNALHWLNFSNNDLGFLKMEYSQNSQVPQMFRKRQEYLSYDKDNHTLTVTIGGGPEEVVRLANVIYRIKAELSDYLGLKTDKLLQLNITVNQTWYREWLNRNWRPPDVENVIRDPMGRVVHISVFGEVDVAINQTSPWKPKKFDDLTQIDNSFLSVYLTPANNWDIWTDQKVETLNFTWEVREFSKSRMRIKINFFDPLAVSPNLRYDMLTIYLDDMLKMFYHFQNRRMLGHERHDTIFKKPVQKQMIDNEEGRKMIQYVYDLRYTISEFFLLFLATALIFRAPFNRILKMMLELQVMVYMALMHIHIPGNAMIALEVIKPLTEFRFQKEFSNKFLGYYNLKSESESKMAYFGQRYTFGFDTYSIVFNIGTMGQILLYFCMFTLVLGCFLKLMTHYGMSKIERRYYSQWLDKLIFNDFTLLLLVSFLEVGASCLVALNDFDAESNSVMNVILAVVLLCLYLGGIPYLYRLIEKKRKKGRQTGMDLGTKYASALMGFKPDYVKSRNKNLGFVGAFLMSRLFFLMIVFLIPSGWVQVIYTIFLFQAYIMFITNSMPMHGKWNNRLFTFNLCCIMGCLYHMMCFTDFVEPVGEYEMGFSFLFLILVFICVNMLFALLDFIYILLMLGENNCGLLRKILRPLFRCIQYNWERFKDWVYYYLNKYFNCKEHWLRYIEYVRSLRYAERQKPHKEIKEQAEAVYVPPPPPPPPPPKPPTPPPTPPPKPKPRAYQGARYKMIDGQWTAIPGPSWGDLAKLSSLLTKQAPKPEPKAQNESEWSYYSEEDEPAPNPIKASVKPIQRPAAIEPKKPETPRIARKWSVIESNFLSRINDQVQQDNQAYHDPALYLRDDKADKSATRVEVIDSNTNERVSRVIESNPNRVFGEFKNNLIKKIRQQQDTIPETSEEEFE